jgi:hypothetical protein
MSTTLEQDIVALREKIDAAEENTRQSDEWAILNDMHLTLCEFSGQLVEFREIQKRNLKLKGK